ncbi:MAG: Fic family protein [Clostridia bacterium]
MYESRNSIYCYDNSDILINKLNIKDKDLLDKIERDIVSTKLLDEGIHKILDIQKLHKILFEDIYYFAGEYRRENIAKDSFKFAEYEYIEENINRLIKELKNENYLKNLDKSSLSKRLAYYMSEFNVLHPFRER